MDSPSSSGQNTVTQTQKLQPFQEDFAKQNQQIAADVAARPYQTYQGDQVAGLDPLQQQGQQMAIQGATAYQPNMGAAQGQADAAATGYQPGLAQANTMNQNAVQQWTPQQAQQYMSPYVMQALQPQIAQLGLQQAGQQHQIDAGAAQAGAFGDARHGVQGGMNDFYGNLAMNGLVSQGMNQAYDTGMQAFQNQQQANLSQAQQQGNLANLGQQMNLNASNQYANLGQMNQQLGLAGSDAVFGAGTQNQQLTQQQLNTAYQNYQNQQNYPIEMLNVRNSTLSMSPYSTTRMTSASPGNSTAQNLGAFAALSGGLGSLFGGVK